MMTTELFLHEYVLANLVVKTTCHVISRPSYTERERDRDSHFLIKLIGITVT